MRLVHSGLAVSSWENADEFFGVLLGLKHSREYTVPGDLMNELFGIDRSSDVRIYEIGEQKLEVFIADSNDPSPLVNHLCIGVDGRKALIEHALDQGFRVYKKEREGKSNLVFFYDRDGNPFEIVEE